MICFNELLLFHWLLSESPKSVAYAQSVHIFYFYLFQLTLFLKKTSLLCLLSLLLKLAKNFKWIVQLGTCFMDDFEPLHPNLLYISLQQKDNFSL